MGYFSFPFDFICVLLIYHLKYSVSFHFSSRLPYSQNRGEAKSINHEDSLVTGSEKKLKVLRWKETILFPEKSSRNLLQHTKSSLQGKVALQLQLYNYKVTTFSRLWMTSWGHISWNIGKTQKATINFAVQHRKNDSTFLNKVGVQS